MKENSLKSSEEELKRKQLYYQQNKDKILKRKKERSREIYLNKRMNLASNEDEIEKEFLRKLSRLEHEKPDACELCSTKQEDLDHYLERHHMSYDDTSIVWVCKTCHALLDTYRRRQ